MNQRPNLDADDLRVDRAPSPEVFRRQRNRFLKPSAFGVSRLALQLMAVSLAGLAALLVATLRIADVRRGAVDAVTQSVLVQSDAVVASLEDARRPQDGPPLLAVVVPEVREAPPVLDTEALDGEAAAGGAEPTSTGAAYIPPPRIAALPEAAAPAEVQPSTPPALSLVPEVPSTAINRAAVQQLAGRILEGSPVRSRIFGVDGKWLTDSSILRENTADDASATSTGPVHQGPVQHVWEWLAGSLLTQDLPPEPDDTDLDVPPPEIAAALGGIKSATRRLNEHGSILVSVATPIYGDNGQVIAALHLRSSVGAVNDVARAEELAIVRVFMVAGLVSVPLAILLAATITRPIRRLARAAERIRAGGVSTPMPELRDGGEVDELSRVLHDMTAALYTRIDSIEAFAGEVAHELKNPLSSMRSAAETLPLAKSDRSRAQLLDVIQHDVQRINRLITDISDASKLDAELNRHRYERFDLIALLKAIVDAQAESGSERDQTIELVVLGTGDSHDFLVNGHDSRLSQVFTNLVDNARSFTPDGGRVVIMAQRFSNFLEVVVEDEGPGIAEEALERVFERFYTDRSEQSSSGNNSGLGLAISRQIIEAHSGEIFAENRYRTTLGPDRDVAGARFTVRLPVVS